MTDPQQNPGSASHDTAHDAGRAPQSGAPAKQKRTFSVGQFLGALLFVLVIVFIAENQSHVRIRIIAGPKVDAPVWVALLAAAVVGGLVSLLLSWRRHRKHS